jgi:hypothetical protein
LTGGVLEGVGDFDERGTGRCFGGGESGVIRGLKRGGGGIAVIPTGGAKSIEDLAAKIEVAVIAGGIVNAAALDTDAHDFAFGLLESAIVAELRRFGIASLVGTEAKGAQERIAAGAGDE